MPTLIDRNGRRDDVWVGPDNATPGDASHLLVTLADWKTGRDRWIGSGRSIGVLLGPADDPAAIAPDLRALRLVAVGFPAFTDGRGYSIARLLRERHGWRGELRAVGEVLIDQLHYLARCGFDSFALADGQPVDAALAAFSALSDSYQAGVDRGPLFARRNTIASAETEQSA
ncbi:MAG: hypothetical protein RIS35_1590 [Pseudomonadota bacterium]|jgi:uncharacterized protein (DUF934 family)